MNPFITALSKSLIELFFCCLVTKAKFKVAYNGETWSLVVDEESVIDFRTETKTAHFTIFNSHLMNSVRASAICKTIQEPIEYSVSAELILPQGLNVTYRDNIDNVDYVLSLPVSQLSPA